MLDNSNFSLVNLDGLSKPANTLIKKVSQAVGVIFAPCQVKRMAKAEAEAAIIRAETDIQITDLHRRAMHRFIQEEANRQQNIESITSKAIPHLTEQSDPDSVEDDWIVNFFDKSRLISDDQMQDIWARVLAGEANLPGSYSKRTVNFLADLDKTDALLFSTVLRFICRIDDLWVPLIFNHEDSIYQELRINFSTLSHLDSIGLIRFEHVSGFSFTQIPKCIEYFGQVIYQENLTEINKPIKSGLPLGRTMFTRVGGELATIPALQPVDGFVEYIKKAWKDKICVNNE